MFGFLLLRNLSKAAVVLEKNARILAMVNPYATRKIHVQLHGTTECIRPKIQNPNIVLCRCMAKGKDKVKKGTKRVKVDERELSKHFNFKELNDEFTAVLVNFKKLLVEQASVRTSVNAIENLKVKYNGETYMVQDLAEIGKKGGKEIILEMSAFFDAIPSVMDTLKKSALGLNPSQNSSSIIVPIPKVTRAHRESLAKGAKSLFTKCRDNIRGVQNKYISKTDNITGVSVDDILNLKSQLTELANTYISEAEEMLKIKEKELLQSE